MEPKHLMERKALNLDVKFQIVVADRLGHQSKKEGRKEGNVFFNDALNTFYFTVIWRRTYGKGPLR